MAHTRKDYMRRLKAGKYIKDFFLRKKLINKNFIQVRKTGKKFITCI